MRALIDWFRRLLPARPHATEAASEAPRPTEAPKPAKPKVPHGLHIQYAPERDGDPDPGEVVWTWVPYEDDPSQGKDRPVIVIGRENGRMVGLALTSKRHDRDDQVELGTGAWDGGANVSYAKLDRLIDLEERPIRREGAVLERARFDGVVDALRAYRAR